MEEFKIFDAHMHSYGVWLKEEKDLLAYMDKYNVEKAIITTINRTKYYEKKEEESPSKQNQLSESNQLEKFLKMAPKGQIPHDDVIKIAKRAPNRIYKFFWFNPVMKPELESESYEILEKHFKEGFRGVKIHPAFNIMRIPKDLTKLASFMQEQDKNLILFIHSMPKTGFFNGVSVKNVAKLAEMFPNLKIILGHAAYAMEFAVEAGMVLKKYSNIYFETSCSVSFGIFNMLKTVGHERILFGSDSPTASHLPIEIQKITTLPKISEDIKKDILYYNVLRLLNEY
ncbi:MAG: amidohydrolase family protein [Promethearchaeota archaeon]